MQEYARMIPGRSSRGFRDLGRQIRRPLKNSLSSAAARLSKERELSRRSELRDSRNSRLECTNMLRSRISLWTLHYTPRFFSSVQPKTDPHREAGRLPLELQGSARSLLCNPLCPNVLRVRTPVNSIEYFPPNFEGLVLGCIDADFCK